MNKLKISTRLAVAFAIMVLLLATLGSVALLRSATQRAALDDIVEMRIPITKSLGMVADGVNVQAIQLRNLAIFSTEAITRSSRERITAVRGTLAEQFKVLDSLIHSDKGREIQARMQQHRAEFLKLGDQYIAMLQQGQKDEALRMLEETLRPVQQAYQATVAEQVTYQAQVTVEAGARADAAASALMRDVLIAAAIAIAMAIFLAVSIWRSPSSAPSPALWRRLWAPQTAWPRAT